MVGQKISDKNVFFPSSTNMHLYHFARVLLLYEGATVNRLSTRARAPLRKLSIAVLSN